MPSPNASAAPVDLLRNTDLSKTLIKLRKDPTIKSGMRDLVSAIRAGNLTADIYQDTQYPHYALLALDKREITIEQFTTTILRWSAFQDNNGKIQDVTVYTLGENDAKASQQLKKFLQIEKLSQFGIKDDISSKEFQQILDTINREDIPASEKQFIILDLKEGGDIKPLLTRFQEIGFTLFMPQETTDGHYQLIIPSMSIINQVLNVIGLEDRPITLVPRIGEDSGEDVYHYHQHQQHPLGLSFPGYERSEADGFDGGCYGFTLHDIYHTVLLKHLDCLPVLNELVEVSHTFAKTCDSAEDQETAKTNAFFFIDGELRQSLMMQRQTLGRSMPEIFNKPEFTLLLSLTQMLITLPALELMKTIKAEGGYGLSMNDLDDIQPSKLLKKQFRYLMLDVLKRPSRWEALGITPALLFNLFSGEESELNELLTLLDNLKSLSPTVGPLITNMKTCMRLFKEALIESRQAEIPWVLKRNELEIRVHIAVKKGDIAGLKALIATEDFRSHLGNLSFAPHTVRDPLILTALLADSPKGLAYLIAEGLAIDKVLEDDTNATALHIATQLKKTAHVKALLKALHNPHALTHSKKHPIEIAIAQGDKDTLLVFLQAGISPSFKYLKRLKEKSFIHADCLPLIKAYINFKGALTQAVSKYDGDRKLSKLNALKDHNPYQFPVSQYEDFNTYDRTTLSEYDTNVDFHSGNYRPLFCQIKTEEELCAFKAIGPFDPNQLDTTGETLLMYLCAKDTSYGYGRVEKVKALKWLIKEGADIKRCDIEGQTALDIALINEDIETVGLLLDAAPDLLKSYPLQQKATLIEVLIQLLATTQLNTETQTLLAHLIKAGLDSNMQFLAMKEPPRSSFFSLPGSQNDYMCMQSLWSYLRHAPIWLQEVTLGYGAFSLYQAPAFKLSGYIDAPLSLRTLCLENGADPNQPNFDGKPELFEAIEQGWLDYAQLLIDKGYELGQTNEDGLTALHHAAELEKPKFIELLLKAGAVSLPDATGRTPLDYLSDKESAEAFQCKKLLTPKPKLSVVAQSSFLAPRRDVATQTIPQAPSDVDDLAAMLSYGAAL